MTAARRPRPDLHSVIACTVLDRDGDPCGRPGNPQLPAGVCVECAVRVYRAVVALAPVGA